MEQAEQIASIEARLAAAGISVSEVCRRAGIDRTTWHRWKHAGDRPRSGTWKRVEDVLGELLPEAA